MQGVWYRDTCQREARRLGVSGWVHNREDGSVEVVIEGGPDAVAALEAWCHVGPPRALVTGVEARTEPAEGLVSFRAR